MVATKFFYIYNIHQAQFFIEEGLPLIEIGIGYEKGEVYHKFLRDENAEIVFKKWLAKGEACNSEVKDGAS